MNKNHKWQIWVDTGGTFTDALGVDPSGNWHRTKVLSSSGLRGTVREVLSEKEIKISSDWSAPNQFIKGFTFVLLSKGEYSAKVDNYNSNDGIITLSKNIARYSWIDGSFEVQSPEESPVLAARLLTQAPITEPLPSMNLRLATTHGTNALLEKKGASTALFITHGFGDLLRIGTQQRPDLFALKIEKPEPLYESVIEVPERIDAGGNVLTAIDSVQVKTKAKALLAKETDSAAVVLMNSYINPDHEQKIKKMLSELGFEKVSISSELSRFVKILPRAETTLVNAYLAPIMDAYLDSVINKIQGGSLSIMTSAGGLKRRSDFMPKDALLSGPAAGVVGAATVGKEAGIDKIISFDMGGTSTDVSRYDSDLEYVFENSVGNAHLMAPAVAIETVAAGGGSICSYDGHALQVGPESAGASPGPACYGTGGPLTLTDVNVLAGRLNERNFHIPIDIEAAEKKLKEVINHISKNDKTVNKTEVLEGFLDIANQRIAETIEKISLRKGYDPKEYALVSFGGAGGQHCCALANQLSIDTVIIPEDAGLLSAYGLGHAVIEHFEERQILRRLAAVESELAGEIKEMTNKALEKLSEHNEEKDLCIRRELIFMRLKGQEATLEIEYDSSQDLGEQFQNAYEQRYGHRVDNPDIEVESIRVIASAESNITNGLNRSSDKAATWNPVSKAEVLFNSEFKTTPIFDRSDSVPGATIEGPALILDPYSTILVEPNWKLEIESNGSIILTRNEQERIMEKSAQPEAVALELFTHRFTSIVEKMGEMLQRTALSVNVKEREDFSCALLNPAGELVVNAPHIPVHLGALGMCVRQLKENIEMDPGDVIITNHPAFGGSHLPDVTAVTPVFTDDNTLVGYTASRAHHAEIGGIRPGSMPPNATNLTEEGVVISPTYLIKNGESKFEEVREVFLNAKYPTRNIEENLADLNAQLAANKEGARSLLKLVSRYGFENIQHYMNELQSRAAELMRGTIQQMENGVYESQELLDDGTPLCATWTIEDQSVIIDFKGTGGVHSNNLNATPAIVNSVVMYVLRMLINQPIPLNEGLMRPLTLKLPNCLLNPNFDEDPEKCPAVVGGNVEISQRLTDTLLKPFEVIACGQGTMNNILFGNDTFGYYETVGGGSGAGPDFNGTDGVHQHMTNTRGTDPEVFEQRYPVRLDRYKIRQNSGGKGRHQGGNGIIREMTFLESVKLSVLTQHRVYQPYGLKGGEPGKTGSQWVIRKDGIKEELAPSDGRDLEAGDQFFLHTPGGGGYG